MFFVVAKASALNPTVAADVMDAGERTSALLFLSTDFSCLVSSCRAVCMTDAGEGICVPLFPSVLVFSFATVCVPEAGEKIDSLRLHSVSLSTVRFPSTDVVCVDNSASLL